jgi:hypothetical protein
MERSQGIKTKTGRACAIIFAVGLALLILESGAYLIGIRSSGIMFIAGIVLVLSTAAISAFSDKTKPRAEEVLTVVIALGFFCWIGWKAFIK